MSPRPQKITLGEMRESGMRRILVYCGEFRCSHHIDISADQWPDEVRLSDLNNGSSARPAAAVARTYGLISTAGDLSRWGAARDKAQEARPLFGVLARSREPQRRL